MSYVLRDFFMYGGFFKYPFPLFYALILILSSPFSLSLIKTYLQNKEYNKYLSIAIILSTIYSLVFTVGMAF